jgi:hypothetical protein
MVAVIGRIEVMRCLPQEHGFQGKMGAGDRRCVNRGRSLTQIGLTLLGLVLAIGGVLTALTGLIGFCPACAMAGRKSIEGLR